MLISALVEPVVLDLGKFFNLFLYKILDANSRVNIPHDYFTQNQIM